jgi:hypothetical protein
MAKSTLTEEQLRQLHDFAKPWGQMVARRAFGNDTPGLDTNFATLEAIARAAAVVSLPRRVNRLVDQMNPPTDDKPQEQPDEEDPAEEMPSESTNFATERTSSPPRVRTCVASLEDCQAFGPMVAAEAQQRGVSSPQEGICGRRGDR